MPFPTTGILDSGTRADESPAVGWTDGPDGGTYGNVKILSNTIAAISGDAWSYWNAGTYGPPVEAYATVPTLFTSSNAIEINFRIQGVGTATLDCYSVKAVPNTSDLRVFRTDNGVETQLGADIAQAFAGGDGFGAEMPGDTLTVYYKSGAGAWTSMGTRTDSTYPGAGHIAVYWPDAVGRITNFGGGAILVAGAAINTRRALLGVGV